MLRCAQEMWLDFGLWGMRCYSAERFRARIHYSDYKRIETHVIETVDEQDTLMVQDGWE